MFMGGGEISSGGGANPKKNFALRAKTVPRSARFTYIFYISPLPEKNPEYAPGLKVINNFAIGSLKVINNSAIGCPKIINSSAIGCLKVINNSANGCPKVINCFAIGCLKVINNSVIGCLKVINNSVIGCLKEVYAALLLYWSANISLLLSQDY